MLACSSAIAVAGLAVAPASAATPCDPGGDTCVVVPDSVQTPLGVASVMVGDGNVVTVRLDPAGPNTLVISSPLAFPPGPPTVPGYARSSGSAIALSSRAWSLSLGPPRSPIVSCHPAMAWIATNAR